MKKNIADFLFLLLIPIVISIIVSTILSILFFNNVVLYDLIPTICLVISCLIYLFIGFISNVRFKENKYLNFVILTIAFILLGIVINFDINIKLIIIKVSCLTIGFLFSRHVEKSAL